MPVVEVPVGRTRWFLAVRDTDLIPVPDVPSARVRDAPGRRGGARTADPVRVVPPRPHARRPDRPRRGRVPPTSAGTDRGGFGVPGRGGHPALGRDRDSATGSSQHWVNDLPETMADLQTEVHQPGDRRRLSYLAATKDGRRIYLNRTLIDADQAVVLTGRGYDPLLGHSGARARSIPPWPTRTPCAASCPNCRRRKPRTARGRRRSRAHEVAWLLGSPFFVQVIEGHADDIAMVVAGLADTTAEVARHQDTQWKVTVPEPADTVVVTLSGDPARHDFAALARAAAAGAQVVKPGGNVVVLSEADPEIGGATDVLRRTDEPPEAVRVLFRERPTDAAAAVQWAWAAGTNLYLASEIRPTTVEEMFATPLSGPKDVQRLLDAPGRA